MNKTAGAKKWWSITWRSALLFECAPDLKRAYDLREELTGVFEADHTKDSGTAAIKSWMKSVSGSGLNLAKQ